MIRTQDDIAAIEHVLAQYCHRLDAGASEQVAELFAEHAALELMFLGGRVVKGRSSIRDWYVSFHVHMRDRARAMRHMHSDAVIEIDVDGDQARVTSYFTGVTVDVGGRGTTTYGSWKDQLIHDSGRWLFLHRRIDVAFSLPAVS